jgi:redox-sensitive bicupin YhaK (pirin superfamily)
MMIRRSSRATQREEVGYEVPADLRVAGRRVPFRRGRYRDDEKGDFSRRRAIRVIGAIAASRIRFTRIPAGMRQVGWHTVPDRVLTVRLDGSVDYETSDGEVRHVPAGGFVLVEDTHGKGHLSRHSPEAQTVLWITLPDGLDQPSS